MYDTTLAFSLRSQVGAIPVQVPSAWHTRLMFPTRSCPSSQKYVAMNPPGAVGLRVMSRPPFVGRSSIVQLITNNTMQR